MAPRAPRAPQLQVEVVPSCAKRIRRAADVGLPWVYFFDFDWMKPCKMQKGKRRVHVGEVGDLKDLSGSDGIPSHWDDGDEHLVTDITVAQYRERLQGRQNTQARVGHAWELEHTVTKHKLHVAKHENRSVLVSLYEQCAEVCQVKVSTWGDETCDQCLQAALEFMIEIGQKYAKDELKKDELYKYRDQKLKSINSDANTRGRRTRIRGKASPSRAEGTEASEATEYAAQEPPVKRPRKPKLASEPGVKDQKKKQKEQEKMEKRVMELELPKENLVTPREAPRTPITEGRSSVPGLPFFTMPSMSLDMELEALF